jgi:hypothetical protein
MSGTLIAHVGGKYRTREELATLPCPTPTETWRPVPHFELVSSLVESLTHHGIQINREQYATSGKEDARLFGVLDLIIPDLQTPEYGMSLGLRASNDRSLAIQATAGARVFVCDNLSFSGDSGTVVLRKKHTSKLDLAKVVPPAIDAYLDKAGAFKVDIERMRNEAISDARAKEIMCDIFVNHVLPLKLFEKAYHLYFDDDQQRGNFPERTLWALNNTFTETVKVLSVIPQQRGLIQLGRQFARLVPRLDAPRFDVPENAGEVEFLS